MATGVPVLSQVYSIETQARAVTIAWWRCTSESEDYLPVLATGSDLAHIAASEVWAFHVTIPGVWSVVVKGSSDAAVNQACTRLQREINRGNRLAATKTYLPGGGRCERLVAERLPRASFVSKAYYWLAGLSPNGEGTVWDDWESKEYMTEQAFRMAAMVVSGGEGEGGGGRENLI